MFDVRKILVPLTFIFFAIVLVIFGEIVGYSFFGVSIDLVGNRQVDGFAQQMIHVETAFADGGLHRVLLTDGLLAVHSFRYIVVWPFVVLESHFGSAGPLALLVVMAYPLARFDLPAEEKSIEFFIIFSFRLVALLLILFVSGRTTVTIMGAGYLILSFYSKGRVWPISLAIGVSCVTLSSSVQLLCLCVAIAGSLVFPWLRMGVQLRMVLAALVLAIMMTPSIIAKYKGFTGADAGYLAPQEISQSVLAELGEGVSAQERIMSAPERMFFRSTIYTSYHNGQTVRMVVYIGISLLALAYLVGCIAAGQMFRMTLPVAVTMLGVFLEGLGFWTIFWPLIWALTGPERLTGVLKKEGRISG